MDKSISFKLNLIIVILLIVIICLTIFNIYLPLKYNGDVKIYENCFEKSPSVYSALDKYIYAIKTNNVKNINKMTALIRRKDKKMFNNYSLYMNQNYKFLRIDKINKIDNNKFYINFSINNNETNNVIIKFYKNPNIFKIYYDEKLENLK